MSKKIEPLPEKEVEKQFEIVKGFNLSDDKRFEPGKRKPHFITEKDIPADDWKELIKAEAVVAVVPESEREAE